jgi:hypothetical protein
MSDGASHAPSIVRRFLTNLNLPAYGDSHEAQKLPIRHGTR